MNLLGKNISKGDTVYSESMGYGAVLSIHPKAIMINHHGQSWRYNGKLIRQGCTKCDLGWRPRLSGNQIKDNNNYNKAQVIINALADQLTKTYG